MKKFKLSVMEYVVLSAVLLIVIVGIISFRIDPNWFVNVYVVEDGFIENLTVIALLTATFTALIYRIKYAAEKSALFRIWKYSGHPPTKQQDSPFRSSGKTGRPKSPQ